MLLLGEIVDGQEARSAGLIDALVPDDPDIEASRMARTLAGQPIDSLAAARRALAATCCRENADGQPQAGRSGSEVDGLSRRSDT
jgi:enoyl-CoA hydratase/carnithine racemase